MEISFRVPRIPAGAWSNVIGLLGLVAMVVAVGGLTGNIWWAVLAGGLVSFGLAVVAQLAQEKASTVAAVAALPSEPRQARAS